MLMSYYSKRLPMYLELSSILYRSQNIYSGRGRVGDSFDDNCSISKSTVFESPTPNFSHHAYWAPEGLIGLKR